MTKIDTSEVRDLLTKAHTVGPLTVAALCDEVERVEVVLHAALKLDACGPNSDSTYAEFLEEFERFRDALAPFKEQP